MKPKQLTHIKELRHDPQNARKHTPRNVGTIVSALQEVGAARSIVIDEDGVVLAGNATMDAAAEAGITAVTVVEASGNELIAVRRTGLTPEQKTRLALYDNRAAELAEWDAEVLAQLAQENLLDGMFTADELQELLPDLLPNASLADPDDVPEPPVTPITQPGDLWLMGEHRLLCGDSTKAEDVERLMAGAKADLCFTSPPYGQQRDYTPEGKEKVSDWDGLMRGVFEHLPMTSAGQVLVNLGLIHRDGEWIPYWDKWIEWMREQGWRRFGWYVWDKKHPMPMKDRGRLLPQHEWVFHFNRKHLDCNKTIACVSAGRETGYGLRGADGSLSDSGRDVTRSHRVLGSVIYAAANAGGSQDHPAVMSLDLPKQFIELWEGSLYEPFCGSGTTLIAAEQLGRKCYGMEISPQYCDVIVKRWEQVTGKTAVRETRDREDA